MPDIVTDILVVGAGAAGMYAAMAAAKAGRSVTIVDKSLVGRGGATIMAQMTVAAALGEQDPDDWKLHLADTLKAGRGICDEELAGIPVVAVTAFAMKGDEERIREGGCEAYISKPISVSHFLDTIKRLLD